MRRTLYYQGTCTYLNELLVKKAEIDKNAYLRLNSLTKTLLEKGCIHLEPLYIHDLVGLSTSFS